MPYANVWEGIACSAGNQVTITILELVPHVSHSKECDGICVTVIPKVRVLLLACTLKRRSLLQSKQQNMWCHYVLSLNPIAPTVFACLGVFGLMEPADIHKCFLWNVSELLSLLFTYSCPGVRTHPIRNAMQQTTVNRLPPLDFNSKMPRVTSFYFIFGTSTKCKVVIHFSFCLHFMRQFSLFSSKWIIVLQSILECLEI